MPCPRRCLWSSEKLTRKVRVLLKLISTRHWRHVCRLFERSRLILNHLLLKRFPSKSWSRFSRLLLDFDVASTRCMKFWSTLYLRPLSEHLKQRLLWRSEIRTPRYSKISSGLKKWYLVLTPSRQGSFYQRLYTESV